MESKTHSLSTFDIDIRQHGGSLHCEVTLTGFGLDPVCLVLNPGDLAAMMQAIDVESLRDLEDHAGEMDATAQGLTATGLCSPYDPTKVWAFPADAVRYEVFFECRHCDLPVKIVNGVAEHTCETDHDAIPELDGELVEF